MTNLTHDNNLTINIGLHVSGLSFGLAHLVFCTKSSNTWIPLEYHLPLPKFMKIKTEKNPSNNIIYIEAI